MARSEAMAKVGQLEPLALVLALLPALLLSLTGCGSGTPGPDSPSPTDAAVVPAAELCTYMRDDLLPMLKQQPSQYNAMMTATSAIAEFYQQHNALKFLATTDLDAATELSCPAVRTAVLKAIGQKNLRAVVN